MDDKQPVIDIREDIEKINHQCKQGLESDGDSGSELEEEKDWFGHYMKNYEFSITEKGEHLATLKAKTKKKNKRTIDQLESKLKALREHKETLEQLFEI